jgi:hypothetical protein
MAPDEEDLTLDERWQKVAEVLGDDLKGLKPSTLPKAGRDEAEEIIRRTRQLIRIVAHDEHQRGEQG